MRDSYGRRDDGKGLLIGLLSIALGIVTVIGVGAVSLKLILGEPAVKRPAYVVGAESIAATQAAPAAVEPTTPPATPVATQSAEASDAATTSKAQETRRGVIVIDAGHQGEADSSLEPIGPGASERKPKVAGGAEGVATGKPESLINLQVARRLRDRLESAGFDVIMVRDSQDVNISNSKRAKMANEAHADLFIRLHCDGAGGSSSHGLSTLIPASNRWTKPILGESRRAGEKVHHALIEATGASDRGVVARSDLSGFNWSTVPTVLVEMGFMSNPTEDRKLASTAYQERLADGLAAGAEAYLAGR